MASYNKVILVGNLTRDPQLSYLPSQTPVCEIGLAINRKYKTADGQQREEVCFVDCRAFGRQAETLNQYMSKGRQLLVEGRLTFDQWETQDGQKRSKHRVTISNFQFLDSGQGRGGGAPAAAGGYSQPAPAPAPAPAQGFPPQSAPPADGSPPAQGFPPQSAPPADGAPPAQGFPPQSAPQSAPSTDGSPPSDMSGPEGEDIPF